MMQAVRFYSNTDDKSIPLLVLNAEQWAEFRQKITPFQQNQLTWQTFNANLGELICLTSVQGHLERVLVGVQDNRYYQALAIASTKLAPGSYVLENHLPAKDLLGWGTQQYKFLRYKNIDLNPRVLVLSTKLYAEVLPRVEAIFKVRDLINTSAEDLGPKAMSDVLESLAQSYHGKFNSIVGDDLLEQNFPGVHAVGRAAAESPRLLSLDWGNPQHPLVVLVGKGVCFDSGGLDLKPAAQMRLMKKDMGGAAQVIGLAQLIMHYALPIRLKVLIPAVENTIDANAYRPGDVIRMRNGLHVEIDNTDAEGRVILADAISYACELSPKLLLNFATLTGAARVAVGTEISALFCNQMELANQLMSYGKDFNDPIWQLPLHDGYDGMLDSNIADMVNSPSSSYAGAITAALFLRRFVNPQVAWGHFDLMAYNVSNKPGRPEGGEAMAMLAVFEYLRDNFR
jgi:leucyl aminopeptidase